METLEDSLRVVAPRLPTALIPAPAGERIAALCAHLAPIHCAGFEVRLGADGAAVDLIQRVSAQRDEPGELAAHIRTSALAGNAAWRRLAGFCDAWADPASPLRERLAGIFLAFDGRTEAIPADDGTPAGVPVPSLYLSLAPSRPGPGDDLEGPRDDLEGPGDDLEGLVAASVARLTGRPVPTRLRDALDRLEHARGPGAILTDVGLRLAGEISGLRLVVAWPRATADEALRAAVDVLEALGWTGSRQGVRDASDLMPSHPVPALSFDLGEAVHPRVGLEYYPGDPAGGEPEWTAALAALTAAGLCTPGRRDALLGWPGCIEPTDVTAQWPASLLVDSLRNRVDRFSVLARRLTFLKLVCSPAAAPRAKAYFGFGPRSFASRRPASRTGASAAP